MTLDKYVQLSWMSPVQAVQKGIMGEKVLRQRLQAGHVGSDKVIGSMFVYRNFKTHKAFYLLEKLFMMSLH